MNVFIVLLTTVSAGQYPAPAPAAAVHPAPVASSCGGSCGAVSDCCVSDCCCQKTKKCRSRKSKDCCCETVSCCPAPCAQPCCAPACQSSCAPSCCAPAAPACCGTTSCCQSSCCQSSCCEPVCCEKPKRRGLFSRRKKDCCCETTCCDSCAAPSCCGTAAPVVGAPAILTPAAPIGTPVLPGKAVEPIKKMPSSNTIKDKGAYLAPLAPIVTPAGAKIETEAKNPFELARRYELSATAHSADFSKLTGQLSYVHADGGIWVLRYAPLSQEDANGGSVILARDRVMSNYKEGDIVTVEGRVISQRGSTRLGGPLYQVREMRLVNRPSN